MLYSSHPDEDVLSSLTNRRRLMQRISWIWSSLFAVVVGIGLAGSQPPAPDINVDTWAEIGTLFGASIVPSQEGKADAEVDVYKVSGVKGVKNGLQVGASVQQSAGQVRDGKIEREVKKALDSPTFGDITVDVKNGVVRLTGTVPSWAWRLEAVAAAHAIPGVRTVEDDLRLMLVM
jgi:osmotically-inducible protein OsmY